MSDFEEEFYGDAGATARVCWVTADDLFVTISTDLCQDVTVDVSVARKLLVVLPRAIAHVEASDRYRQEREKRHPARPLEGLDFSVRAHKALIRAGIKTLGDLTGRSYAWLAAQPGIGPAKLEEIEEILGRIGLALAPEVAP